MAISSVPHSIAVTNTNRARIIEYVDAVERYTGSRAVIFADHAGVVNFCESHSRCIFCYSAARLRFANLAITSLIAAYQQV